MGEIFLLGLLVMFAIPALFFLLSFIAGRSTREAAQDIGELRRLRIARREQAVVKRDAYFASQGDDWPEQAPCSILNGPPAMFMLSNSECRIQAYDLDEDFTMLADVRIPLAEVLSVDLARPKVKQTVYRTEHVPTFKTHKKSPLGRAALGGAVFGPFGAVVGAISGVGGTVEANTEVRRVAETRDGLGRPQLILGTRIPSTPVVRAVFETVEEAQHWLYRLRPMLKA